MSTTTKDRPSGSDTLTARLEHLEQLNQRLSRQVGRMKAAVTVLLILAAVGLFWGLIPSNKAGAQAKGVPNIIRANGFVIVDKDGVERGSFGYNDRDQVAVLNLEPFKSGRINLGIGRNDLVLRMNHGDKNDINMGYTPKGGMYFNMKDKEGKVFFEQKKP